MTLARKLMVKASASVLSSIVTFVSLIFMSHYVGYEYGVMMRWLAIIGLINVVIDLGFNSACIKSIGENKDLNDCVSSFIVIKCLMMIVFIVMVGVYLVYNHLNGTLDPTTFWVTMIFTVYYLLYDITWIMICSMDGLLETTRSANVQFMEVLVRSSFLIFFALTGTSAVILSSGYLIGIISALCLALFYFRDYNFKFVRPTLIKYFIDFMKPVALGIVMMAVITFIDKVIIGASSGSQDVGYYSAAMGAAYAVTTLGLAINNVLLPRFSELNLAKNRQLMKETLWYAQKYVSIFIIPILVLIILFGTDIVTIFLGEAYKPAGYVLSIMSIYIYTNVMAGMMTQLLHSTNCLTAYRRISMVFSIMTIVLFFILIPDQIFGISMFGFGIQGAAWALSVSYLILLLLLSWAAYSQLKITFYPKIYKQFICAIATGVILYAVKIHLIGSFGLISLTLTVLAGFALYIVLLCVTREINIREIKALLSLTNIAK